MAENRFVNGVKILHLICEPATEVLKYVLTDKLHRSFLIDNKTKITPKLKASQVPRLYPLDDRHEESVLSTLDVDFLKQIMDVIEESYGDLDNAETIISHITIVSLQAHLHKHYDSLKNLNAKKKILSRAQWTNMFPVTQDKWRKDFDITLVCFILKEIFRLLPTTLKSPPAERYTTPGDDIERIRFYRNAVAHGDFLEKKDFSIEWKHICGAIIRLGGPRYRNIVEDIHIGTLDENLRRNYEELLKEWQSQEKIRSKTVEKLEKRVESAKVEILTTVDNATSTVQTTVINVAEEVKEKVKDVDSNITDKIDNQTTDMKTIMRAHQEQFSSKIYSSLQTYENKVTETMDNAIKKYTDRVSKELKKAEQTGNNSETHIAAKLSSFKKDLQSDVKKEIKDITGTLRSNEMEAFLTDMNRTQQNLLQEVNEYIMTWGKGIDDNVKTNLNQVSKQYEDVARKLKTLQETRNTQGPDAQWEKQVDELKREVQGMTDKITTSSADITDIKNRMNVQIPVLEVRKQYEDVAQKLKTLQETRKTQGFDAQWEKQVDSLKREVQGMRGEITTSCADIADIKNRMNVQIPVLEVSKQYEDVAQKLKTLQETRNTQGPDAQCEKQVDELKREVQGMRGEITASSADIADITKRMNVQIPVLEGWSSRVISFLTFFVLIASIIVIWIPGRYGFHNAPEQMVGTVIQQQRMFQKMLELQQDTVDQLAVTVLKGSEEECFTETDIIILLDSSGSVKNEGFETMKRFIAGLTLVIKLHPNNVQLGLITFDVDPKNVFAMNEYHSSRAVRQRLQRVDFPDGEDTNIGRAIDHVRKVAFAETNGGRKTASKVLILLTDGSSSDDIQQPSVDIHKEGVTVVTIGVGKTYFKEELEKIASDPALIFDVESFDALDKIKYNVLKEVCNTKTTTK